MKKRPQCRLVLLMLTLVLSAGVLFPASAEEPEAAKTIEDYWLTDVQIKAVYTEAGPSIDGSADEAEWQNAYTLTYDPNDETLQALLTQHGGLCTDDTKAWPEGNKATLRFLWDDEALYILDSRVDDYVYYEAPATAGGSSQALPWAKAEGAIFAIQPLESLCPTEADGDIWQFYTTLADDEAAPNGAIQLRMTYPSLSAKNYVDLPENVRCAASLTEDGWQMEIAIPWSCFEERFPVFKAEAGYQMSLRISIGNYLENGKMYFYSYTDAYKSFGLTNADFGGYPVLALADADGNVPEYDMSIPSTVQPDDPGGNPSGEDTGDVTGTDTGEEPVPTGEPAGEQTTAPTEPAGTGDGSAPTEPQKPNTVLIVVLAIGMIGAVAAAVVVIVRLKKLVIRIVAGVLAAAILAGCTVGIVLSVKAGDGADNPSGTTPPQQSTTGGSAGSEPIPESKVPDDLMFPGEKVSVLLRENYKDEFDPEYTGALIDNEVFLRNEKVAERLGITLDFVTNGASTTEYLGTVRTSIMGGPYYDIITAYAYYGSALAAESLYYNLNIADPENYISTDLPWYNQSFVRECSYSDLLYFIVGDVTLTATDRAVVTFFNEDLFTDYHPDYANGILDLYDLVLDGGWTLEYVQELIKDVYDDIDRDGRQSGGDLYGMVFNNGSMCVDAMLMAVGIPITETTDDGNVEIVFQQTASVNAFQSLFDFIYESDGLYRGTPANNEYYGTSTNYFSDEVFYNGRTMLEFGLLESAKVFATDSTLHYGILPLPKLNAQQDSYATTPQDAYSIVSLPYNIGSRLGLATATLEVMSECSYTDVRPTYHELAYKVRYASSDTTGQLFDLIVDTIAYDFGSLYGASIENPLHKIRNLLSGYNQTSSANLGSIYRVYGSTIEKKLEDLLTQFDEIAQASPA